MIHIISPRHVANNEMETIVQRFYYTVTREFFLIVHYVSLFVSTVALETSTVLYATVNGPRKAAEIVLKTGVFQRQA